MSDFPLHYSGVAADFTPNLGLYGVLNLTWFTPVLLRLCQGSGYLLDDRQIITDYSSFKAETQTNNRRQLDLIL